ncbi:threonylcarbamoyl-AMP synthase [Bacteroidales bacterium OttesenSCG-928-K03]|nr:threonylcarbamoyl-AMP synthase [Odoribacter sp. OttesenSCG-928-L07]MDL2238826.1 threonylcarbamoyl-AMP synthase [Bacteroidales bacterium OttesenSCG-928-L14]MDL2240241.1 threonylcarbamoyl-AMP synthase [Bacteroidales bacterium OttesenSCG-928-K22]MDL2242423.1 threonylcarbamoyl-AMP synthase [Bacteroidales bacterium OttesenSCG-928-K03]
MIIDDNFNRIVAGAVEILRKGKTILYPTDTIWGIGCDATNSKAVDKVYQIKRRPEDKSPILLIDDEMKLFDYVDNIPPIAIDLINSVRNPVSIIYPRAKNLPDNVIANDGSVAIRVVKHTFCKKLINLLGKPIVSTSANISGQATPLTYNDIAKVIFDEVDYVVSRSMEETLEIRPSTIVKFNKEGEFEIIRS